MPLSELGSLLNVLIGVTAVSVVTAGVAAVRKIKSGNIVDDDAVIARLDTDNVKLRKQLDEAITTYEVERRTRWRAEDMAATWKRQLMDMGEIPAPVGEPIQGGTHDRT